MNITAICHPVSKLKLFLHNTVSETYNHSFHLFSKLTSALIFNSQVLLVTGKVWQHRRQSFMLCSNRQTLSRWVAGMPEWCLRYLYTSAQSECKRCRTLQSRYLVIIPSLLWLNHKLPYVRDCHLYNLLARRWLACGIFRILQKKIIGMQIRKDNNGSTLFTCTVL